MAEPSFARLDAGLVATEEALAAEEEQEGRCMVRRCVKVAIG